MRTPKVFLFDEPLSNLDAKLRNQLRLELKRLHQTLGTTMIYVTHDQVEAMTLADRIVVLNGGDVQQIGTPDELYSDPENRFVAGFIGSPPMKFLEQLEADAIVGVRPHDVQLGSGPFEGEVTAIERLGFESHVHVEFNGESLTARVEGESPALGTTSFNILQRYRFAPDTGQRLR